MNLEKEHNSYIGDVVNGLAREAAFFKVKCTELEQKLREKDQEIQRLKTDYSDVSRDSAG